MNKNEVEDGWWKKSYSDALQGVKVANYVASDKEESSESEYESSSEDSTDENGESSDESSESEYDEKDEQQFKDIAKKYLKVK